MMNSFPRTTCPMTHPLRLTASIALVVLSLPVAASAQSTAPAPVPAPAPITWTASLRTRVESWDWFDTTDAGRYAFLGAQARLGIAQQRPRIGWQVELEAPLLAGLPSDAVRPAPAGQLGLGPAYFAANDGRTTVASVFLKQAVLRLGAPAGRGGHALRVGRMEFAEGAEVMPANPTLASLKRDRVAQRLVGPFGFSHVGRAFDGVHYTWDAARTNVTATAFRPTEGVFQVDGWGSLNYDLAYAAVTRQLGAARAPGEARLFALYSADHRAMGKVDNRAAAVRNADLGDIRVATLGAHYLRLVTTGAGAFDATLWGAGQAGDWGALTHRAWAGAAEVGWQPALLPALRPWVRAGYFRSSGDGDASDRRHGTFYQVLPTPRVYARTPFYNLMNSEDLFASLLLRPGTRWTLRSDARSLRLANAADLWYAGGGPFEKTTAGYAGRPSNGGIAGRPGSRSLAMLVDLSAEFRWSPHVTVTAYSGHAAGGTVIENIYPGSERLRLTYLELELRR
ncbi:MAG: alginate export family protein [Gemmatimonadaceae bacterium]